jgi:ribosomal protein S17E
MVVDNVKKEAEKLYKKYKISDEFEDEAEGALVMPDMEDYYLLLDKGFITHNTIAHEIFHAAVRITEDRGITDEEAQAWMAGHITETLYKFLEKKKLQVKHG